jgi:hypothetical protein
MVKLRVTIPNVDKYVKQLELSYIAGSVCETQVPWKKWLGSFMQNYQLYTHTTSSKYICRYLPMIHVNICLHKMLYKNIQKTLLVVAKLESQVTYQY